MDLRMDLPSKFVRQRRAVCSAGASGTVSSLVHGRGEPGVLLPGVLLPACLSVLCHVFSQPSSHSRHAAASSCSEKKAPASWCSENPDEVDTLRSVAICPCCPTGSPQQNAWPLEGSSRVARVARQGLETLQTRLRSDASLALALPFSWGARTTTFVCGRGIGGVTSPLASQPLRLCVHPTVLCAFASNVHLQLLQRSRQRHKV